MPVRGLLVFCQTSRGKEKEETERRTGKRKEGDRKRREIGKKQEEKTRKRQEGTKGSMCGLGLIITANFPPQVWLRALGRDRDRPEHRRNSV